MGRLTDLLSVPPEALEALLAEESAVTWQRMNWQHGPLPKPLPGLAWMEAGMATGYLAIGMRGSLVSVGRLFVRESSGPPGRVEQALLAALVQLAFGVPGVEHLVGDLLTVSPGTTRWLQSWRPGQVRMRALMARPAAPLPGAGAALEPLAREDLPAVAEILLRTHAHRGDPPPGALNQRDFVTSLLGKILDGEICGLFQPEASFRIRAPGSGALLGFVLSTRMGPDQGHVAEIAVEPSAGRQGLGSALLAGAVTALAGHGCRRIHLAVDLDNRVAVHWYQRMGFSVRHPYPSLRLVR